VQLANKLFRVKNWPRDELKKPVNYTFRAYNDASGAWEAVKKAAEEHRIAIREANIAREPN
jgi:hypothetical protein